MSSSFKAFALAGVSAVIVFSFFNSPTSAQSREAERASLRTEFYNTQSRLKTLDVVYNQLNGWLNGPGRHADPATRQSVFDARVTIGNQWNSTKSRIASIRQQYNNPNAYGGHSVGNTKTTTPSSSGGSGNGLLGQVAPSVASPFGRR